MFGFFESFTHRSKSILQAMQRLDDPPVFGSVIPTSLGIENSQPPLPRSPLSKVGLVRSELNPRRRPKKWAGKLWQKSCSPGMIPFINGLDSTIQKAVHIDKSNLSQNLDSIHEIHWNWVEGRLSYSCIQMLQVSLWYINVNPLSILSGCWPVRI